MTRARGIARRPNFFTASIQYVYAPGPIVKKRLTLDRSMILVGVARLDGVVVDNNEKTMTIINAGLHALIILYMN